MSVSTFDSISIEEEEGNNGNSHSDNETASTEAVSSLDDSRGDHAHPIFVFDNLQRYMELDDVLEKQLSGERQHVKDVALTALETLNRFVSASTENALEAARFDQTAARIGRTMKRFLTTEDILVLGCRVLAEISTHSRTFCCNMGACRALDAVALAMMRNPTSEKLAAAGSKVIRNVVSIKESALHFIKVWNGQRLLIAVLKNQHFVANEKLHLLAVEAMFALLSWDECIKPVKSSGGLRALERIVAAANKCGGGGDVDKSKLHAAAQKALLVVNTKQHGRGGVDVVRKLFSKQKQQLPIEQLLHEIKNNNNNASSSNSSETNANTAAATTKAFQEIRDAVHGDSKQAFENRAALYKAQADEIMVTACETWSCQSDILCSICDILADLAATSLDFRKSMRYSGVLTAVVNLMNAHAEDMSVQLAGLGVLGHAVGEKLNAMHVVQTLHGHELVIAALLQKETCAGDDDSLQYRACWVLSQLVRWDECTNDIEDACGLDALKEASTSSSKSLKECANMTIKFFS